MQTNPFVKGWRYLMALFDHKIEENADPKIQIEQAIQAAQTHHAELSRSAASIIGNKHQIEMRLSKNTEDTKKLLDQTKQAISLADKARANGDEQKAQEYEAAAESFVTELSSKEAEGEELKVLHGQAESQAAQAKLAVENNARQLEQKASERTKLLSQLEQAKMQEKVSESLSSMGQIAPGDTPTLDGVREKIESRYANALGSAELSAGSAAGRMEEIRQASIESAGKSRLEELRGELGLESGSPRKEIPANPYEE